MELIVLSGIDPLVNTLEQRGGVHVLAASRADMVLRLVRDSQESKKRGERTDLGAVYVDDLRSGVSVSDLWSVIEAASTSGVRVLVNLTGAGKSLLNDVEQLGIVRISETSVDAVVAWIGRELGLSEQVGGRVLPVVSVGAAKGGIGKTFVTTILAEALRRRGLNVLVWDTDISNPGLVTSFHVPLSAPSYLSLVKQGAARWNPRDVAEHVYCPSVTRGAGGWGNLDLLIGSHAVANAENDIRLTDWQLLYEAVVRLEGYDLVLIDTPPDYMRRPYATHTLDRGGFVVLPCPPGRRERIGVAHMLDHFQMLEGATSGKRSIYERTALLEIAPEKGVVVTNKEARRSFAGRYPMVRVLGTLPRAPHLASVADEHEGYLSMLDAGPKTTFTHAAHRITDSLLSLIGVQAKAPMPKFGAWDALVARMRGEVIDVPPAGASLQTLVEA